jgi:hypothetical protein
VPYPQHFRDGVGHAGLFRQAGERKRDVPLYPRRVQHQHEPLRHGLRQGRIDRSDRLPGHRLRANLDSFPRQGEAAPQLEAVSERVDQGRRPVAILLDLKGPLATLVQPHEQETGDGAGQCRAHRPHLLRRDAITGERRGRREARTSEHRAHHAATHREL